MSFRHLECLHARLPDEISVRMTDDRLLGVFQRAQVHDLAAVDPGRAEAVARAIRNGWYRCQALSRVAEYTRDPARRLHLIQEAFAAAAEQAEPNRIVTASSYPLGVLCRMDGRLDDVQREVDRLLAVIGSEPHSLRRGDGLHALAGGLWHGPPAIERSLLEAAATAYLTGHGWRRDRSLMFVVQKLARLDRARAVEYAQQIDDRRFRRKALGSIGAPTPEPGSEHR